MMAWKARPSFKSVSGYLPTSRQVWTLVFRTRFLMYVGVATVILFLWRELRGPANDMQRFVCWGPTKPPMDMSPNEAARWEAHHTTPVTFNHHNPVIVQSESVKSVDLNPIVSTRSGASNKERVLIATPLRNAGYHISKHFDLLLQLTYPHNLIDLAFIVSDCEDDTLAILAAELDRVQQSAEDVAFRSATVIRKDFGVTLSQEVKDRHGWEAQAPRRKALGKARNYLLSSALKDDHAWVYWRDVDINDCPSRIIEDMIEHDKDVITPNIWFHRYEKGKDGQPHDIEGRFDYNAWIETDESRKALANLDRDFVIAEGYKQIITHRKYMTLMGNWRDDKDVEMELDGIGGVSIMVKADVHRSGINFPSYPFENQAETEGFAKMAKRAGYKVIGLPNYVVWHVDTEEKPGNSNLYNAPYKGQ